MTENQKLHKQYAFEDFMKTVLRNKARNIHKKIGHSGAAGSRSIKL